MKNFLLLLMASFLLVLSACGSSEVETVEEKQEVKEEKVEKPKEKKETEVETVDVTEDKEEDYTEKEIEEFEEMKAEVIQKAEWIEHKAKLLEYYEKISIVDIQTDFISDSSDFSLFSVFNVVVPTYFKEGEDKDKQFFVEENGPYIVSDLEAFFPDKELISVYFEYEDGDPMAIPLSTGGWEIQ